MDDRAVVAIQLDREPRSPVVVTTRCHLGLPVVIQVPPHLDDGTPFPTTYWLTCPLAGRRIGRLEAAGGVKAAAARLASDPELAARHDAAMKRYAAGRDALIGADAPRHRPSGGVGGVHRGVKCLHAHYADFAAGNANPIGVTVAADIEPLDCAVRCVIGVGASVVVNPDWREPK